MPSPRRRNRTKVEVPAQYYRPFEYVSPGVRQVFTGALPITVSPIQWANNPNNYPTTVNPIQQANLSGMQGSYTAPEDSYAWGQTPVSAQPRQATWQPTQQQPPAYSMATDARNRARQAANSYYQNSMSAAARQWWTPAAAPAATDAAQPEADTPERRGSWFKTYGDWYDRIREEGYGRGWYAGQPTWNADNSSNFYSTNFGESRVFNGDRPDERLWYYSPTYGNFIGNTTRSNAPTSMTGRGGGGHYSPEYARMVNRAYGKPGAIRQPQRPGGKDSWRRSGRANRQGDAGTAAPAWVSGMGSLSL